MNYNKKINKKNQRNKIQKLSLLMEKHINLSNNE